jgi:hypothetical protein
LGRALQPALGPDISRSFEARPAPRAEPTVLLDHGSTAHLAPATQHRCLKEVTRRDDFASAGNPAPRYGAKGQPQAYADQRSDDHRHIHWVICSGEDAVKPPCGQATNRDMSRVVEDCREMSLDVVRRMFGERASIELALAVEQP